MIRVVLPVHLQTIARVGREVELDVSQPPTAAAVLDALEEGYPALRGTVRDQTTGKRRPFVRYFACGEDLSHDPDDTPLPEAVTHGDEPFMIVGAMSGG
jgi:molybdopterin synthase sulfur carrier subunit